MSVIGGICGRDDSQESLSNAAAVGAWGSSSTPGVVGKANKQRAGRSVVREAGAPRTLGLRMGEVFGYSGFAKHLLAAAALVVTFCLSSGRIDMEMGLIRISAAASVNFPRPHASLEVALHVTKRQNGAKASNRVSVSGGICGRDDSQESLSNAAAVGAFGCWSGRYDASRKPNYVG